MDNRPKPMMRNDSPCGAFVYNRETRRKADKLVNANPAFLQTAFLETFVKA